MATPVTPVSLVANRAWRPSAAESIDDDLTALWREIARGARVARDHVESRRVLPRGGR